MKKKRTMRFVSAVMCFVLLVVLCPRELAPIMQAAAEDNGSEGCWILVRTNTYGYEKSSSKYYRTVDGTLIFHEDWSGGKEPYYCDQKVTVEKPKKRYKQGEKIRLSVTSDISHSKYRPYEDVSKPSLLNVVLTTAEVTQGTYFSRLDTDGYPTKQFDTVESEEAGQKPGYYIVKNGAYHYYLMNSTGAIIKEDDEKRYIDGYRGGSWVIESEMPDHNDFCDRFYLYAYFGSLVAGQEYEFRWTPLQEDDTDSDIEAKDGDLYLYGSVKNAAGEKMPGLDLHIEGVFESDPDTAFYGIDLTTDKNGEYKTTPMTIHAAVKDPALKLTLKMQYIPYGRTPLVIFTDNSDPKLEDGEVITVTALIKLDRKKIDELKKGELKYQQFDIDFKWLLSKYKPRINILTKNANDFTTNLSDSITVKTSGGSESQTAAQRLANASILYSAAADAHTFASDTLGEKENMQRTLTVNLRSKKVTDPSSAHYDPETFSINLGADTSMRDDDSVCTILHEFGHAFDHFTSGNQYFHLNNTYDEKNKKWLDTNHFGIFNATMNDSYTEGFANFFAAMVRKNKGLKNPEKLVRSDLSLFANNYAYNNASYGSSYEEDAIASFLYNAEESVGDVKKMWSVLKPDRGCFKDYYDAVIGLMTEDEHQRFDEISIWLGLHTMPYEGNGVYDYGEPFLDENENEEYDEGEPFYDLVFKQEYYEEMGGYVPVIDDEDKWIENFDKIVYGRVADYKRSSIRKNFPLPDVGYMNIEADGSVELPEYYLVTVDIPDEGTYTSLRRIYGGGIFLFDPTVTTNGTITVSIPGGGEIFSGDIGEIGYDALAYGKDYYAASATVTADKLAPKEVIAVPTYGESGASGYIDISENAGIFGDVDGDGDITSNDALAILRKSVGMADLTPEQTKLADVDGDGDITSNDALAVLRYSVGIESGGIVGKETA